MGRKGNVVGPKGWHLGCPGMGFEGVNLAAGREATRRTPRSNLPGPQETKSRSVHWTSEPGSDTGRVWDGANRDV